MNTAKVVILAYLLLAFRVDAADSKNPGFDDQVAPILARRCLDCHSGPEPKGKLDLSRRVSALQGGENGPAIVPGDLAESLVWEYVFGNEMPPKTPLPDNEKAVLKHWILAGAGWGIDPIDPFRVTTDRRAGRDWWAFRPLTRPAPPASSKDCTQTINPIDAFINETLDARGLSPSPRADRRTLIRRLSFDLNGLPPTPEEVSAFESDPAPDAYERLVDRLLASPAFGVRWARLWLDVARFGESNGFEYDEFRPNAWRYRDWVVSALNANMRYDDFVRLQLAGDLLRPDDPTAVEATGFLVGGAYDTVGQAQQSLPMRKVVRQDEMEDLVGTVGQTFLGLTIHCARCHDHKFDPIRQADYYRLAATLSGISRAERDLSPIDPMYQAETRRLARLTERIQAIEGPARALRIAAGRSSNALTPLGLWSFADGPNDQIGALRVSLQGGARLDRDGLKLDGETGYAQTPPIDRDLTARTFVAWVRLDQLQQRGGGVIGLQTLDGNIFDTIVFGERDPGQWMAGSDFYRRTQPFAGAAETDSKKTVCMAITYATDGTISAYRDGLPYGRSYPTGGPVTFRAGQARFVFGMRHGTGPGSGRMLAGQILRAAVFEGALQADEIATISAPGGMATDDIAADLSLSERSERARLLNEREKGRASLVGKARRAYAIVSKTPDPTFVLARGNPASPGAIVAPGGVAAVPGPSSDFGLAPDATDAARRVKLADWIVDSSNPLTARTLVNRLWQAHFGSGLVETSSDLGFNGGRPSHPLLLDWLASEFNATGGDIKALHRLIVTSAAYRRSSRFQAAAARVDAASRFLWRMPPRRLEAEMVRDAMLSVSGALNPTSGGPGYREFALERAPGSPAMIYKAVDPTGPALGRRTLYRTWARGGRDAFLDAFDCPDPSTATPRRAATTTPLQALALLNNALTIRLSITFADRLRREAGDDPLRQVDRAYLLALGRPASDAERAQAVRVVNDHGAEALARAVFNSNEFLYVD